MLCAPTTSAERNSEFEVIAYRYYIFYEIISNEKFRSIPIGYTEIRDGFKAEPEGLPLLERLEPDSNKKYPV